MLKHMPELQKIQSKTTHTWQATSCSSDDGFGLDLPNYGGGGAPGHQWGGKGDGFELGGGGRVVDDDGGTRDGGSHSRCCRG